MLPIQENCADERKYRRQEGTALPTHMNHYARTPLPAANISAYDAGP
jgi:hypothetical protein